MHQELPNSERIPEQEEPTLHPSCSIEYQDIPKQHRALLSHLMAGLVRPSDRDRLKQPTPIVICDPAQEIIVDGNAEAGDHHIKGVSGYVNRILVACDASTIFLVPAEHVETTRALARHFTAKGLSSFKEENIVPVDMEEGMGLMGSVEAKLKRDNALKTQIEQRLAGKPLEQAMVLPFIQTEDSQAVEGLLGTYAWQNPALVERMNHKGYFGEEIRGVAATVNCCSKEELMNALDVDTLATRFGKVGSPYVEIFLKGNRGASGASTVRFRLTQKNASQLKALLNGEIEVVPHDLQEDFRPIFEQDVLQNLRDCLQGNGISIQHSLGDMEGVERFYESDGVNFWIGETDEDTFVMGHSLQILNGNTHLGNEGPLPLWMRSRKARNLVHNAILQMKEKGYRGPGGFDIFVGLRAGHTYESVESHKGDLDDVLVSYLGECNGRMTGQTHANALSAYLDAAHWVSKNNLRYVEANDDESVEAVLHRLQAGLYLLGIELDPAEDRPFGVTVVNLITGENKAMLVAVLRQGAVEGTEEDVWWAIKSLLNTFESAEFQYRLAHGLDRPQAAA